jgi:AraC-like DNA-binding protein/effector-binding domain-containing protein
MPSDGALLRLLHDLRSRRAGEATLGALATRSGWSPFHLHRAFHALVGETPKQYVLRLQLERGAARLLSSDDSVLDIAIETGFNSHEVFTRAFRRHFGRTPAEYRAHALSGASSAARRRHVDEVRAAGPCISLYHLIVNSSRRSQMPTLSIERRQLTAQPFLFVRLRAGRHEISKAIAEGLGKAFPYVMQNGLPIAGRPMTRYLSTGPGLFDLEIGVPVAVASPGEGDVQAGELPGGPTVIGMHAGPYEQLSETYAAMERWMEANGYRPGGAPWESYVTDPGDFPDTKDWRTEVYWPIDE